ARPRDPSGSAAGRARMLNHLATALARHTGAFKREETLGMSNLAGSPTARACPRFGAALRARTGARLAGHRSRDVHLCAFSLEGAPVLDRHVAPEARPPPPPAAPPTPRPAHAEKVIKNIGEG